MTRLYSRLNRSRGLRLLISGGASLLDAGVRLATGGWPAAGSGDRWITIMRSTARSAARAPPAITHGGRSCAAARVVPAGPPPPVQNRAPGDKTLPQPGQSAPSEEDPQFEQNFPDLGVPQVGHVVDKPVIDAMAPDVE